MIIGITGSIASGKSVVTDYLKRKGLKIVDADLVSRKVVEPGQVGLLKIVEAFGKTILLEGQLNRRKLRDLIFSDEEKRLLLNRILHPIIHEEILRQLNALKDEKLIIFDAPLLLENNLKALVDELWVVSTDLDTQINRLKKRDHISEEDAHKIINKQMPLSEKIKYADLVLENNSTLDSLYLQIEEALKNHL